MSQLRLMGQSPRVTGHGSGSGFALEVSRRSDLLVKRETYESTSVESGLALVKQLPNADSGQDEKSDPEGEHRDAK